MVEREVMTRPRRRSTPTSDSATFAVPSWSAAPEPSVNSGLSRAPTAGFDFGSIAIYAPEPQIGPEGGVVGPATAGRIRAKQGSGALLESPVRRRMEGAFGHNFADVRIHTDSESDTLNRDLSARAFTHGSDIFLGQGASSAATYGGDALMTHELTHVVQQRGTGRGGPMTVDPVDASAERDASAVAHDASAGMAIPAQMQPVTRNHAVLQRLASAPDAPATSAEPADLAAQSAFNVMDTNHKLLRAIDQSHLKIVGFESQEWGGQEPIYKRHIDVADTVAALNHLTAAQMTTVKEAYQAHEHRALETDLFGGGESGYPTDLTDDASAQIRALLGGTQAGVGASKEERQAAETHDASAKAAELHALLKGDLEKDDVERVMGILRQDATANAALIAAYGRLGGDLRTNCVRMGPLEGQRAWKLLDGDSVGADAFKVSLLRARISGIDERIAKLLDDMKENPYAGVSVGWEIKDLEKERKKLVEDIEQRAEQAGAEARAGAKGDAHAAVQARVAAVLGDAGGLATAVGGADAAVIRAVASDDPVDKVAAQLHKSAQDGKLTAEQLTAALRSLRTEAEERAQQSLPKGDPRVEAEAKRLADDYFGRLRSAYNNLIGSDDDSKRFDDLINDTGDKGDTTVNIALMQGHGKLEDVAELVLALQGDRKDTAAVERVLRDKSAAEIKQLKLDYMMRSGGRSLDFDLFGAAPTQAGEDNPEAMGQYLKYQGKASGTSRLNLEDYMQRPDAEGGPAEVAYIAARAEREYDYTIANRGATGAIRDTFGNEERDLLDETIKEVRKLYGEYCVLVGWVPESDPEAAYLKRPEVTHSGEAHKKIQKMQLARATIRGDRTAYEKATAELRAMFEMAVAFVLQAAISALLTPAAGALLEAVELGADAVEAGVMTARIAKFAASTSVNVVSTVGANFAVYGDDYSVAMLKADLLGGLGGSIGGEAVEKMLGPVSKGLVERLGPKASTEIIALAKTAGSIKGGAWAQGMSGDLSLQNIIKTHLMGKAAGAITEATGSVTGLTPKPGAQTVTAPEEHATPESGHATLEPAALKPTAPTPEPSPAGGGPSGRQGEGQSRALPGETTVPMKAGKPEELAKPGDAADAAKTGVAPRSIKEEAKRVRGPVKDDEQTQVDWNPDEHRPERALADVGSLAAGHALYEQMLNEDPARDVMVYRNVATGEVRVGWGISGNELDVTAQMHALGGKPETWEVEAGYRGMIPAGSVMWAQSRTDTRALFEHSTAVDPYREVSLEETDSGDVRVVQGDEKMVLTDPQAREEAHMGDGEAWGSPEHYHPLTRETNETPKEARYPTSSGGDFEKLEMESRNAGNVTRTARVRYWVKRGDEYIAEYTDYTYDPNNADKPYMIEYHDPETGVRMPPERFESREAYEEWYSNKFQGWRVNVSTPPSGAGGNGSAPSAHAPGKEGGGSGESESEAPGRTPAGEPAESANAGEGRPELRAPGDDEPTQVNRPPEDPSVLAQLKEEIRRLVEGEGTRPLPESAEEMARSNMEVELAQRILQDPNATPQNQREAIRTLAERAVAEERTYQLRIEKIPGLFRTLTAGDLRGMCVGGRDISTDAIIALLGNSPHEIRIERIQAQHLGFEIGNSRPQHGFVIVTLADGTRFLIDPTFAQFADQIGGGRNFTAEGMLSSVEGSTLARDLLRDGMVPLTDDAVRQYVIGLGADPAAADAATARLMSGGATLLTEIVRNGQVERFPGRPEEAYNQVNTVSDPEVSPVASLRLMLSRMPEDHPLRPLLESLTTRLEALAKDLPPLPKPPNAR